MILQENKISILKNYPEDIIFEQDYEEYQEIEIDKEPFSIEVFEDQFLIDFFKVFYRVIPF